MKTYRVSVLCDDGTTRVYEGVASSRQNACRQAFRKLIGTGYLNNQPKTNDDWDSSFENVQVQVVEPVNEPDAL